jgi:L-seryl-tRNA(Ser) seleniumtransferase
MPFPYDRWGTSCLVNGSVPQPSKSEAPGLRSLPSVNELAGALDGVSHGLAVRAAREAVEAGRDRIRAGQPPGDLEEYARARAKLALSAGPRPVLNATGVIVHTNLGRAPLAERATRAAAEVGARYSDLEYDVGRGTRGSRQDHVEGLLRELTGADAALVVNNCAAAVLLATGALAAGRRVVVSRGQLVEIGGSFRIPEVVAQSGASIVEVGTTNRTRLDDYRRAIDSETGALLWAHQSNFRVLGFVEDVPVEELCRLGVPVIADLGSGRLAEGVPELETEPLVPAAVAAGAAVTCFSGDKLLGGPQAGIMVGSREAIEACRSHPLARAVRIDKLSLAALAATLSLYRDPELAASEIPVLRMLSANDDELRRRAQLMCDRIAAAGGNARLVEAPAKVGGGALPLLELTGTACAVDPGPLALDELARRLRSGDPVLLGRARDGQLLLDPRTLTDDEASLAADAVVAALA